MSQPPPAHCPSLLRFFHRRVQERYKEYDGTYLGHYVQYFFWFFFVLGLVIFGLAIFLMLDSHYHWTK